MHTIDLGFISLYHTLQCNAKETKLFTVSYWSKRCREVNSRAGFCRSRPVERNIRNKFIASVASTTVQVGILGASGYTGAELLRILSKHPHVQVKVVTAERSAGKSYGEVFGQFQYKNGHNSLPETLIDVSSLLENSKLLNSLQVIFCCLPHGTSQAYISQIPSSIRIVDLSADFRLQEPTSYQKWYGKEHKAVDLQKEAVYGLVEVNRASIRNARLVANPGCYPTAAQLALIPLLKHRLIDPNDIVIDAKSGVSGAGRALRETSLFCEVHEGIHAYGVGSHRHIPEIEQGLSEACGHSVVVNFTPHLIPMSRGILESIYVKLSSGVGITEVRKCLEETYANEHFVTLLSEGIVPQTRFVKGTNHCLLNVFQDRISNRIILFSAIDNLVKGASGQAVQNMNLLCGFPEETALQDVALFP
ncbi:N-acetyl-gamma-glutamyl-phosphate reductase [Galdieria sulphuraria]|uniref:N-acetyl-gamma-glutamyl-phosphate reductase n=1 Tax=Galdieria sulphuraria TaxID=130081 RepID=M2Y2W9_GALSU|nr:N-acetyl-gamma-glutamyl-phosphate reductase [Galdieria sulphuraria]EME30164.1 N-acetyl-gamma-glutamyl-phosphate reductase [Galdieria sulphuraria]|eukprot:XP_005706684.1 N-acetyl-gamma-glutamyl-phosphate reductase [Galdieria sulphuraria]